MEIRRRPIAGHASGLVGILGQSALGDPRVMAVQNAYLDVVRFVVQTRVRFLKEGVGRYNPSLKYKD
jgi:hypothetical protein